MSRGTSEWWSLLLSYMTAWDLSVSFTVGSCSYFFDGRKAAVGDFIDPEIFDTMIAETGIYQEIVAKELPNTPMAISETGLVLKGGGELSGSFVACFL